ncbi:MAG: GNAT family N-acetyltransferase [Ruminococcaceae bacterium]|nr:GNAT family N-acetyltransferase [Oscillospiraceae bacterium]
MKLTFRKATDKDLNEILLLYKSVVKNMIESGINQWSDEYPNKEVLSQDIANNELILAIDEVKIIGAFVMNEFADEDYYKAAWQYPDLRWCVIHRLCVSPSCHRQGIAVRMMEYAERKARKEGFESIHLDTFSGNPKALSLYHKIGFTDVGEAFWARGRFVIMEKKL